MMSDPITSFDPSIHALIGSDCLKKYAKCGMGFVSGQGGGKRKYWCAICADGATFNPTEATVGVLLAINRPERHCITAGHIENLQALGIELPDLMGYKCPLADCAVTFSRKDRLGTHCKQEHDQSLREILTTLYSDVFDHRPYSADMELHYVELLRSATPPAAPAAVEDREEREFENARAILDRFQSVLPWFDEAATEPSWSQPPEEPRPASAEPEPFLEPLIQNDANDAGKKRARDEDPADATDDDLARESHKRPRIDEEGPDWPRSPSWDAVATLSEPPAVAPGTFGLFDPVASPKDDSPPATPPEADFLWDDREPLFEGIPFEYFADSFNGDDIFGGDASHWTWEQLEPAC